MTALLVLARVKLVYQRRRGEGRSSGIFHFLGSFKLAKEGCQCGRSEASALGFVRSEAASSQLHFSGLIAVPWRKRDLPCAGCSGTSTNPSADTSLFTTVLELAKAILYLEKTY